jgi:hypothetical protein
MDSSTTCGSIKITSHSTERLKNEHSPNFTLARIHKEDNNILPSREHKFNRENLE